MEWRLEATPFRPSWIRTPGRMQNTYANESFIDELAAAAKTDPLEFRRKYLDDKRGLLLGYGVGAAGYALGLWLSVPFDLPSGPLIVCVLAALTVAAGVVRSYMKK